jgi:predicted DNA-binding protein (MmcQ/YjbR family)
MIEVSAVRRARCAKLRGMMFTKRLRPGIRRGEITCSVRIWQRPRVKVGHRYPMEGGQIEVDSIEQVELEDVTANLARESGFNGLVDLLKVAKHGSGNNVYLVRFHYIDGIGGSVIDARKKGKGAGKDKKTVNGDRQRTRIAKIVESLPEGEAKALGGHLSLEVRNKRFGWFMVDHHGDGRVALNCKASSEMHDILRQLAPDHFHIPKYLGNKGWIGLWLDLPKLDWAAVELALVEAYRRTAPKKLARR